MKTISLALVLATALGLKINEAATTTTDQHQINNLYNNSTVNSADDTIEPIQLAQVQTLAAADSVEYQSSLEVRQELLRAFKFYCDKGNGQTMSYDRWRGWMTLKLGKDAFQKATCGLNNQNCPLFTGVLFQHPNFMGLEVWMGANGIDGDNDTMNFDEFLQVLRVMNEEESPGYFHELLAAEGLQKQRLGRVTFETRTIFRGDGKCPLDQNNEIRDCGYSEFTKAYKIGRSTETAVTETTTKKIEANIGIEFKGLTAGIAASYETSFSSAVTEAAYEEHETSQLFHLNLNVPNFLFQNVIKLEYLDGREQTLYGLAGISHMADAEPYKRVVTYNQDQTIVSDQCFSGCGGNKMN